MTGDVEVADGRIVEAGLLPRSADGVAVPGFVDRQVNGFAGVDLRDADRAGYERVAVALARHGVTAFCPTFYSSPIEGYLAALGVLAEVHRAPPRGARVLGAHLEGPFLSPAWAGAHDSQWLVAPDLSVATTLLGAGPVAVVTLAPELPGADAVIAAVRARGAMASMGHTDATAAQAHHAVDAGVSMITHCHNAHRRFAPRDPGPAGVALVRPEVTVGLICDGVHLAPETVLGVFAAAGPRVAVVTDAVAPAATAATAWSSEGQELLVETGQVRDPAGRLAGSAVAPDACLRWMLDIGVPEEVAITAMATTPAVGVVAGAHDLRPGSVADLVVLDDRWEVVRTLIGGQSVE